jgi:hypothetical protein
MPDIRPPAIDKSSRNSAIPNKAIATAKAVRMLADMAIEIAIPMYASKGLGGECLRSNLFGVTTAGFFSISID